MIQAITLNPCACGSHDIKARNMCGRCYQRWRVKNRKPHRHRRCKSDHCSKEPLARGYCVACYNQFIRNGQVKETNYGTTSCTVDGCDKPHRARGFCYSHYNKASRLCEIGLTWEQAQEEFSPTIRPRKPRLELLRERAEIMKAKKAREEKRLDHYTRSLPGDSNPWSNEEADHLMAERSAVENEFSF